MQQVGGTSSSETELQRVSAQITADLSKLSEDLFLGNNLGIGTARMNNVQTGAVLPP